MLPRLSGLDICEQIRTKGISTACLMLTARDSLDDRLEGFKRGTDDYLVKPFAMEELHARINALYRRRSNNRSLSTIKVVDLSLDLDARTAKRANRLLELSPTGWRLLVSLAQASPSIISRTELEDAAWPNQPCSKDAFKMQLYRLRQQVDIPGEQPILQTIRGVGFCLRLGTSDD